MLRKKYLINLLLFVAIATSLDCASVAYPLSSKKPNLSKSNMFPIRKLSTLFKHYGSNLPASSLVQVNRLFSPDLKIEVEAVIAVE